MTYDGDFDSAEEQEDYNKQKHRMENMISLSSGEKPLFVGVYEVDRAYGGPEEGGWWVDTGYLVRVVICNSEVDADYIRDLLREGADGNEPEFPRTGKRNSVLGGEDYDIFISDTFPVDHFPEVFPHYE